MEEKSILSKSNNLDQFQVQKTNPFLRALAYIGLIFLALIDLFPIYWMFTFSLKDNAEVFGANVMGLPQKWLWSNYVSALTRGNGKCIFHAGNHHSHSFLRRSPFHRDQ